MHNEHLYGGPSVAATMSQTILVVGGADTGRAPMAAALLRRLLEQRRHSWPVGSAGVLGHDGDPAEIEARETMAHMGLNINDHQARSLSHDLVAGAALLLAVDSGTALVIRASFPGATARVHVLGTLAGRSREIPDPFRMQIGAWITYAREIAALLEAALPQIIAMLPAPEAPYGRPPLAASEAGQPPVAGPRAAAADRIVRLLRTVVEMPDVVDWVAARGRIEADLGAIAAAPRSAGDLVAAYAGLLRAALAMTPAAPSPGQLAALHAAAGYLAEPVGQPELNELSMQLGTWATL